MNGRKARQRNAGRRQRERGTLAAMRMATPRLTRRDGAMEWWRVGPATVAVPALLDTYPAALTEALEVRRKAIFTGRCVCGAQARFSAAGRYTLDHASACEAGEQSLAQLADAAGVATQAG